MDTCIPHRPLVKFTWCTKLSVSCEESNKICFCRFMASRLLPHLRVNVMKMFIFIRCSSFVLCQKKWFSIHSSVKGDFKKSWTNMDKICYCLDSLYKICQQLLFTIILFLNKAAFHGQTFNFKNLYRKIFPSSRTLKQFCLLPYNYEDGMYFVPCDHGRNIPMTSLSAPLLHEEKNWGKPKEIILLLQKPNGKATVLYTIRSEEDNKNWNGHWVKIYGCWSTTKYM